MKKDGQSFKIFEVFAAPDGFRESSVLVVSMSVVVCCAQLVTSWLFRQRSKRGAVPEEKWVFKQLLDLLEKNRSSDLAGRGRRASSCAESGHVSAMHLCSKAQCG